MPGNAGALACKRPALRTLTNAVIVQLEKSNIITPEEPALQARAPAFSARHYRF